MKEIERRRLVFSRLQSQYRHRGPGLSHDNPFQLLVAVILSAQCTDVRVNEITRHLFSLAPTPGALLDLGRERLEREIRSCGLYRAKAGHILETCRQLLDLYGGAVPRRRDQLEALPGIGRKSASVILSQAFGQPALAVDTHVFRVSRRLGVAAGTTPERVEKELTAILPRSQWSQAHFWLISHGREMCLARGPRCEACFLADLCPERQRREVPVYDVDQSPAGSGSGSGF